MLRDNLRTSPPLEICRRYGDFADFFVGSLALNVQQRMVKGAAAAREISEDRSCQARELRKWLVSDLGLSPLAYAGDLNELVDEALRCAEVAARSDISKAIKKGVKASAPDRCYSCGGNFGSEDQDQEGTLIFTCDHLWPASLGGDTIVENLLPACQFCNGAKEHMAAWQMGWIQPAVYPQGFAMVPKPLKLGLHMRAAVEFAHNGGASLKDAFLAIGPRQALEQIDAGDSFDFFNMRVHDEVATAVSWVAQ